MNEVMQMKNSRMKAAITQNREKLKTRHETLDNVEYLVAPVVMVKEQVLNGELLPAEEIAKSAPGWNGRPVVVYHPKDNNGQDTIANDPAVVPKYEVGKVYNVEYEEGTTKLKGEVWIDISRAKRKNRDTKLALHMIENSEELEVSTGYIVNDRFVKRGVFDNVEYMAIQRDILPDHLALLPQEIGACSWEDGAGVRNNSRRVKLKDRLNNWLKSLAFNVNSRASTRKALSGLLSAEYDDFGHIDDVIYDKETMQNYVVFSTKDSGELHNNTSLYAINYTIKTDDESIILGDILQEVTPIKAYNANNSIIEYNDRNKEENNLNRHESIVRDVIATNSKFGRKDKSTLMALNDNQLISMLPANKRMAYVKNEATSATVGLSNNALDIISNLYKGRTFKANAGEQMVAELIQEGPDAAAADLEGVPIETLEEIADTIVEGLEAADIVITLVPDPAPVEEAIMAAEEVLSVVEETIANAPIESVDGEPASDEPMTNMDTTDAMGMDLTATTREEETVQAISANRSRMRYNARKRNAEAKLNEGKAKAAKAKSVSINDYINAIPDAEAREFIKNGVAEAKRHRQELMSNIAAHKANSFSEPELKRMETNHLEKIYTMLNSTAAIGTRRGQVANTSYSIKGIQTNNKEADGGFVPLTKNIFMKEAK